MLSFELMENVADNDVVAIWKGRLIKKREFISQVITLTEKLPDYKYAVNLCEDRYLFLVSFVATLLKKQTNLLPPSRASKEIERIGHLYKDSYCLTDEIEYAISLKAYKVDVDFNNANYQESLRVDNDHLAAILFTSGSTGTPQANAKYWSELVASTRLIEQRYLINKSKKHCIIATVPPQHMFGFELSIIYPLVTGTCVSGSKPFYPQDIVDEVNKSPYHKILVTTPIHLRACESSSIGMINLDFVLSATANLPFKLAKKIEKLFSTQVCEIYGCTEVGAIATRTVTREEKWKLLDGYEIKKKRDKYYLTQNTSKKQLVLADSMDLEENGLFSLKGRNSDFLNIAGKRGSIGDLNVKLKNIEGVEDGVFIMPDSVNGERTRLIAMVVAPSIEVKDIFKALSEHIDQVFLPRPIIKLESLPYNETGKLTRHALMDLFHSYRKDEPLLESA